MNKESSLSDKLYKYKYAQDKENLVLDFDDAKEAIKILKERIIKNTHRLCLKSNPCENCHARLQDIMDLNEVMGDKLI